MTEKEQNAQNYEKYLNCPDCKKVEFYCKIHKDEVESLLRKQYI